ncbi:MAG: DEAD/DEAH box helicase [Alphaproteobacteria bacterium]|nr:DEAD/DEAH box helicase [Alphaproteobacteria bacterium]
MTVSSFSDLGLAEPILRALHDRSHTTPTPIQAKAIPEILDGADLLGIAQTGTGKTGAFALPILDELNAEQSRTKYRTPRALILAPTRELAIQIGDEFRAYGKHIALRLAVIFGGVSQHSQVRDLRRGIDVLVATPGRLLDLMEQGHVELRDVEFLVLDEADRMLDMGFIRDVRKIVARVPEDRQTQLFSATMPPEIAKLAKEILYEPVRIDIAPKQVAVEVIRQGIHFAEPKQKLDLLCDMFADPALSKVIVFTRTKHRANRVAERLNKSGVDAQAIHGNKSQGARQRALEAFRNGSCRVLVATDIAARGIDVPEVSHVINYEMPMEAESYVHRIGRTARAGAEGAAISLCATEEAGLLIDIEKLIGRKIPVESGQRPAGNARPKQGGQGRQGGRGRHGGGHGGGQSGGKSQGGGKRSRSRRRGGPSRRAA